LTAAFQAPTYEVTWNVETGEASTLKVLEKDGKLYAAFDPSQRVYTLPEDFKGKIQKEVSDFRNRRILSTEILDVQKVDIDGTVYKAVAGNWYLEADAAKAGPQDKFPLDGKVKEQSHVRAFMVDLEFAKTDRFIALTDPLAKSLTEAPLHRITLSYTDPEKAPLKIELFKAVDAEDKFVVRRSGAPYIYRVPKAAFSSMTPAPPAPEGGADAEGQPMEEPEGDLELDAPAESSGVVLPESAKAPG
jgi:hypothetical protein